MLQELLTVIGGDDQERLLQEAALPEVRDEPPQLVIHLADPRIVEVHEMGGVSGVEGAAALADRDELGGGAIGRPLVGLHELGLEGRPGAIVAVDVVVVEEHEERTRARARQPLDRLVGDRQRRLDLAGRLFDVAEVAEPPVEPVGRGQVVGVHRRRRVIAARREHGGERRHRRGQVGGVRLERVVARVEPGQERGVRGERPGRWRRRVLEQDALGGESVEQRGGRPAVPVAAEVVGTQGIDRDQEDDGDRLAWLPREPEDGNDREEHEQRQRDPSPAQLRVSRSRLPCSSRGIS